MSDPFRQYFLESIQNTLEQDADEEALLALFRFVSPSLTLDEMLEMEPRGRGKIMKILKSRIHPDKHPNYSSVTTIFQNVQNFYDECIKHISTSAFNGSGGGSGSGSHNNKNSKRKRRKRPQSTNLSTTETDQYPQSFNIFSHWPVTNISLSTVTVANNDNDKRQGQTNKSPAPLSPSVPHPAPPNNVLTKKIVPAFQAYKCIHARGAIAHGRPITKFHTWYDIQKASDADHSVQDIFDEFGGTKELDSVELIKREIMTCGPVVSVSFRLLAGYLRQLDAGEKAFAEELIGEIHELLIVGWCLTPYGEAWQVQPLIDVDGDGVKMDGTKEAVKKVKVSLLHIGFGQFGIDETVLAPESNLEDIPWQPGPYFDSDFSDIVKWRDWEEMDLPITETELKALAKCFKNGFFSGESFVLRDQIKKAHSASYKIKNIKWVEETQEWFITIHRHWGD